LSADIILSANTILSADIILSDNTILSGKLDPQQPVQARQ
jgi:hypothetical protein